MPVPCSMRCGTQHRTQYCTQALRVLLRALLHACGACNATRSAASKGAHVIACGPRTHCSRAFAFATLHRTLHATATLSTVTIDAAWNSARNATCTQRTAACAAACNAVRAAACRAMAFFFVCVVVPHIALFGSSVAICSCGLCGYGLHGYGLHSYCRCSLTYVVVAYIVKVVAHVDMDCIVMAIWLWPILVWSF